MTRAIFVLAVLFHADWSNAQNSPAPARRVTKETVSWPSLVDRLPGHRTYVGLADGSVISGKVARVEGDRIVFTGKSPTLCLRPQVKFVQYDLVRGKSRAGWTTGLLLAGAGAGLLLGAAEVFGENGDGFVPAAIGLAAGGGGAGYAIGQARDRQTFLLTLQQ